MKRVFTIILPVVLSAPSAANGLTVTNFDRAPQSIAVIEKNIERQIRVLPGQTMEGLCAARCKVKLSNGAEYTLNAGDRVSIERGELVIDSEEVDVEVSKDTDAYVTPFGGHIELAPSRG
jgi:hypothetical protein